MTTSLKQLFKDLPLTKTATRWFTQMTWKPADRAELAEQVAAALQMPEFTSVVADLAAGTVTVEWPESALFEPDRAWVDYNEAVLTYQAR